MTAGAVVVLRSMARRWRAGEPSTCPRRTRRRPGVGGAGPRVAVIAGRAVAADLVAAILFLGVVAYAVFAGRRLRQRGVGPDRRRRRARRAAALAHRPRPSARCGRPTTCG